MAYVIKSADRFFFFHQEGTLNVSLVYKLKRDCIFATKEKAEEKLREINNCIEEFAKMGEYYAGRVRTKRNLKLHVAEVE